MLTGEAAWDFLLRRSNLYPRADVLGYRKDGVDEMVPVKLLDPVAPIQVLVYTEAEASKPLGRVSALIAPAETALPPRLLDYLPLYPTLEDWQKATIHG
jgi:hypothetical protein